MNLHNRDEHKSIVYQESVDGSEFDPLDSDLWMDTWGTQIEEEEEASPNMESIGLPMLE